MANSCSTMYATLVALINVQPYPHTGMGLVVIIIAWEIADCRYHQAINPSAIEEVGRDVVGKLLEKLAIPFI